MQMVTILFLLILKKHTSGMNHVWHEVNGVAAFWKEMPLF